MKKIRLDQIEPFIFEEIDTLQTISARGNFTDKMIILMGQEIPIDAPGLWTNLLLDCKMGAGGITFLAKTLYSNEEHNFAIQARGDGSTDAGGNNTQAILVIGYSYNKTLTINAENKVGINTDNAKAALDINGDLIVRQLPNAQGDSTFTKQVVAKPDGTFGVENKILNRQVLYVTGRVNQTGTRAPVVTIDSQDVNDAALTFTTQYIAPGWYLISVASTLVTLNNYKIEAFIQDKALGSLAAAITDDTKFEFQGSTMVLLSLRNGALTDGITANQFSIHLYKR